MGGAKCLNGIVVGAFAWISYHFSRFLYDYILQGVWSIGKKIWIVLALMIYSKALRIECHSML